MLRRISKIHSLTKTLLPINRSIFHTVNIKPNECKLNNYKQNVSETYNIYKPTNLDKYFISREENKSKIIGRSKLHESLNIACAAGDLDSVKKIFDLYGNFIEDIKEAIFLSCIYGHLEVLKFLHSKGGIILINECLKMTTDINIINYLKLKIDESSHSGFTDSQLAYIDVILD